MKCKVCKSKMIIRDGKFGKFYACPTSTIRDNHGTISIRKEKPYKASIFEYEYETNRHLKVNKFLYEGVL